MAGATTTAPTALATAAATPAAVPFPTLASSRLAVDITMLAVGAALSAALLATGAALSAAPASTWGILEAPSISSARPTLPRRLWVLIKPWLLVWDEMWGRMSCVDKLLGIDVHHRRHLHHVRRIRCALDACRRHGERPAMRGMGVCSSTNRSAGHSLRRRLARFWGSALHLGLVIGQHGGLAALRAGGEPGSR